MMIKKIDELIETTIPKANSPTVTFVANNKRYQCAGKIVLQLSKKCCKEV